jgi:hypothetical protein
MHRPTPTASHPMYTAQRTMMLCAAMALCMGNSMAQERSDHTLTIANPSTLQQPARSAAPQGRTRAEVIAELACARASGELEAMVLRSYGLSTAPSRPHACAVDAAANQVARPQSTQQTPQPDS